MDKVAWARQLEQDSWDRTARTGKTGEDRRSWDISDQTTGTGLPRQVGLDKSGG